MIRNLFLALLTTLGLTVPVCAEPGVALLMDSRYPEQAQRSAQAKKCLYILQKQNGLPTYQFSLKTVDFASYDAWRWRQDFQITGRDLPALACYFRQGNKLEVRNLIRRYGQPQQAAEAAFRCIQTDFPNLVRQDRIQTGLQLESQPSGATVSEHGLEVGQTPCQLNLAPGRHVLSLSHPDCLPFSQTVSLSLGDQASQVLTLPPAPAHLDVESTGAPMDVRLDDQPSGTTPLSLDTSAGTHRLAASGKELFDLQGEVHADANRTTLVRLSPTPARLRVGLTSITAQGYTYRRVDYEPIPITFSLGYGWGRCGGGWPYWGSYYNYGIPYEVNVTVELSDRDLTRLVLGVLEKHREVAFVEPDRGRDCNLKYDIQAHQDEVVGEVAVLDAEGKVLTSFSAQRDMPWLTFDSEDSAQSRAAEVAEELTGQALGWIVQNRTLGTLSPEEQEASIQVQPGEPLTPAPLPARPSNPEPQPGPSEGLEAPTDPSATP